MEKDVLLFLYEHRGGSPLTPGQIRHRYKGSISHKEIEYVLGNLIGLKLVRPKKIPALKPPKPGLHGHPAYNVYEIHVPGVSCVENNFELTERAIPAQSIFINSQIAFGDFARFENNFMEIANTLNVETKTEVVHIYHEIEQEMKKDMIDKNKIKCLLKTLADKGLSKLFEAAIGALIKEFIA